MLVIGRIQVHHIHFRQLGSQFIGVTAMDGIPAVKPGKHGKRQRNFSQNAGKGVASRSPEFADSVPVFVKTFEYAKILARRTCENVAGKLSTDIALNINVPNLPPEEVKGIKYARLGNREYKEFFSPIEEGSGYAKYRYTGDPVIYEGLPDTIDVIAMQDGYATITPLHRDLTDYNLLKEMEKWRIEK